jgi:uncharacterized caspase-like protein
MFSAVIQRVGATALLLFAQSIGALADKRVALVIGNSSYQNVPKLPNPTNDARAIADLLRNAGFDVIDSRADLGIAVTRRALREFADAAHDADIAVVYYAGHGIEVDGINYLVPVDASLERDTDVEDEAISVDRVLRVLEAVKRLRLVILDACRENPFARSMKRTIASRDIGRGLAKVEVVNSDTLIAFSAKAGSIALDGQGKNSPFTTALLRHLATPGLDLRIAFGQVRDDVLKATGNKQEPFVYGSLGGGTVALVPAPVDPLAEARRDYELFERGATVDTWDVFLKLHSDGPYADLARAQRAKLIAAEQARAAEEARAAEQAKAADKKAAEQAKAAEAARLAEEAKAAEKGRLEAQRAAERAKAEQAERELTQRRAAEQVAETARVVAEAKAAEQARTEAAQRRAAEQAAEAARIAAEAKAAEQARVEAQKAAEAAKAEQLAAEKKAAEQKKAAAEAARLVEEAKAEKAKIEAQIAAEKAKQTTITERLDQTAPAGPVVAALAPTAQPLGPMPRPEEIAVLLQAQLKRVGCDPGDTSGIWGEESRRALDLFNRSAGTTFDTKAANLDALEAVRGKSTRVCPLVCGPRYRTEGDRCIAISCRPGFSLNGDGNCVRRKEPAVRTAIRHEPQVEPKRAEPKRATKARQAPVVASREEGVGQSGGYGRRGGFGRGRGGGRGGGGGMAVSCGKGGCQTVVGSGCHAVGGRHGGGQKSTFGKVVCM